MKNKLVIITSWALVVATMAIIFIFSSQNADSSSSLSQSVVVEILDIVMDKEDITPTVIKKYHFPIRKLAHFGIYMLLGFCMINAFNKSFKLKKWLIILLSIVASGLYAVSDEIHQNFTAGRGPGLVDVLIDTGGAIVGISLFILFIFLYNKIFNKKSRA